jgi:hypothetical protein
MGESDIHTDLLIEALQTQAQHPSPHYQPQPSKTVTKAIRIRTRDTHINHPLHPQHQHRPSKQNAQIGFRVWQDWSV